MKCSKCHADMNECFWKDSPGDDPIHGWTCHTLDCIMFGIFVKDSNQRKNHP